MLIALQFPLTDFRRFIDADDVTARLPRPNWAAVEIGEFLRAAGNIQSRRAGGSTDWVGEEFFCHAHRAVRLPGLGRSFPLADDARAEVDVSFRRFFSDKTCVRRLEIGFSVRVPRNKVAATELLGPLLDLNVRIPSPSGTFVDTKLHKLTNAFATFYLGATTGRKAVASAKPVWIEPGDPIIVIESEPERILRTYDTREIVRYSGGMVKLFHDSLKRGGHTFTVWTIERDVTRNNLTTARELRVNLLRWHAEQQSMRKIVRAIGSRRLTLKKNSEATDHLDDYLNERISYLDRATRGSTRLAWSEINEVAREATDRMSLVHQGTLGAELVNLRKNIRRKTREFIVQNMHVERAEIDMSRKFGNINTGGGDFRYAEGDQTNVDGDQYVAGGDIQVTVGQQLDELDELITQAQGQVPPADAAKLKEAAAAVRAEATKEKPDESQFRVTAKGLLDAAKAVAGIAAPVAKTLKTIYGVLFGGGWPF